VPEVKTTIIPIKIGANPSEDFFFFREAFFYYEKLANACGGLFLKKRFFAIYAYSF